MSRPAARHPLPASDDPSVPQDLATRWAELFGCPAPHRSALMAQAVAWKEQVNIHGDVPPHILRDLRILAHQVSEARGSTTSTVDADPPQKPAPSRTSCLKTAAPISGKVRGSPKPEPLLPATSQLAVGTRLVKHHGGETHVVEVTDQGMLYREQIYGSLSAVAKAITGTHWNGLLFFGLRRRKTYDRKKPRG